MTPPESSALLDKVKKLAPEIAAQAAATEKNRDMAPELVAKLRDAGLFRFMIPAEFGGEDLNQLQACRVIEELARADAVAGWNGMVIFGYNIGISRFPREVVKSLLRKNPDVLMRGALAPLGKVTEVEGGYIFNGQWPFASGSYEPEWVVASGVVFEDGAPKLGPNGMPQLRMGLMPGDKAKFLDTWDVVGLNGTASHDFTLKDVFVPADHTTNFFDMSLPSAFDTPTMKLPFPALTGPTHSAVVIGIAQGALDEVAQLSRSKRSAFNPAAILSQDPVFRHRLGELGARVFALRSAMDRTIQTTWDYAQAGKTPPLEFLSMSGAVVSYTHVQCVDIVNELFTMTGSTPIYSKSNLQKRWRDVRAAAQHIGASQAAYGNYGTVLVGETPETPFK